MRCRFRPMHRSELISDRCWTILLSATSSSVCNDGKRVRAYRPILAGRSDMLKCMLMGGMAESRLSQISLPEISSPVLRSVFEFLYTGTLSKHHPQSWRMACELIVASRFFLQPNLEMITRKIMHTITSGVAQDLPKVASFLTEAIEFEALRDEMDVNLMELVTILSSNWSDSIYVRSLSEEAFHYLLRNSKGNFDEDDKLTFTEYHRFRQVIRWCISKSEEETVYFRFIQLIRWCSSKSEEESVEELLNFMAPDELQALSLFIPGNPQKVGSLPKDASLSNDSSPFQNENIRNLAIQLSSHIDYRQIHPVLLATVVEPLNIISATQILDSFRFHALWRRPKCSWHLGDSYSTLEQGFVIKKKCLGIGFAVSKAAIWRSYGIYQWSFTVEEYSETFCEVGFIYYTSGVGIEKPKFQGTRLSEHHYARVLNFQELRKNGAVKVPVNWNNCWKVLSQFNISKSMRALFTFNASERTCSLSFDGGNVRWVWNNLPTAVYSPAVSLGNSCAGRVRIELVGGFDVL